MSTERPLRLVFGPALTDAMLESVLTAMDTELQPYAGYQAIGASSIDGNKVHIDLKPTIFLPVKQSVAEILAEVKDHYPTAKVEEVHILRFVKTQIASQLGIPEDKVF